MAGWLPVGLEMNEGTPRIEWRYVGEHRFVEPSFEESLGAAAMTTYQTKQTSMEALEGHAQGDCVAPTAFLFHASRCGSTLLAQLLATDPKNLVMAEPPIVESALQLGRSTDDEKLAMSLLKAVVGALGQRRGSSEERYFVKLDSWHVLDVALMRRAFPTVPFVYLYRRPLEILASHCRERGQQMVPGLLDLAALEAREICLADLDRYCLHVLSCFFQAAAEHATTTELRLMNFTELPGQAADYFAARFRTSIDLARANTHSKRPTERFVREPVSHVPVNASDLAAADLQYEKLESLRRTQIGGSVESG